MKTPDFPFGLLNIRAHPDYRGAFTREQAREAKFANGSRVEKTLLEPGDGHPLGARATVLGSIYAPGLGCAYFVEWDATPRVAVLVVEGKISAVTD